MNRVMQPKDKGSHDDSDEAGDDQQWDNRATQVEDQYPKEGQTYPGDIPGRFTPIRIRTFHALLSNIWG